MTAKSLIPRVVQVQGAQNDHYVKWHAQGQIEPGAPGYANDGANESESHWGHRPGDGTGMGPNPSMSFPLDKEASSAVGIPIFKNNFSYRATD